MSDFIGMDFWDPAPTHEERMSQERAARAQGFITNFFPELLPPARGGLCTATFSDVLKEKFVGPIREQMARGPVLLFGDETDQRYKESLSRSRARRSKRWWHRVTGR